MYENELQKRIADLKTEIDNLPAGSVTKKTIEGKVYYFRQRQAHRNLFGF